MHLFVSEEFHQTPVISVEEMKVLSEVSKSIGYLHGPKTSGTCWRVGKDKVITAAHVVTENISKFSVKKISFHVTRIT